jgi:hypothetical protein
MLVFELKKLTLVPRSFFYIVHNKKIIINIQGHCLNIGDFYGGPYHQVYGTFTVDHLVVCSMIPVLERV